MTNPHLHNPLLPGDEFFWPAGPTGILLCHGFTATTAEVRPLGKILFEAGYSVAGPLLPGHNTSPQDLNRVHWQDWVQAFNQTYKRLLSTCQQVVLGGESTGALLALHRASRDPRPAAILAYAPALQLAISPLRKLMLYMLAPWRSSIPKPNMQDGTPWQGYAVNPLKGTIQLLKLQRQVDPYLHQIHQPILIIQGRQDATVHPGVPERIATRIRSDVKEVRWMENSPHTVIVSRELDQVSQITLKFLQRLQL